MYASRANEMYRTRRRMRRLAPRGVSTSDYWNLGGLINDPRETSRISQSYGAEGLKGAHIGPPLCQEELDVHYPRPGWGHSFIPGTPQRYAKYF